MVVYSTYSEECSFILQVLLLSLILPVSSNATLSLTVGGNEMMILREFLSARSHGARASWWLFDGSCSVTTRQGQKSCCIPESMKA